MALRQNKVLLARALIVAILAVGIWAVAFHTGVVNTDEAGVRMELPEHLGDWEGIDIWNCLNRNCAKTYYCLPGEPAPEACAACGGPLTHKNWAEASMLPADTGLVRKFYRHTHNPSLSLSAAIVLSGDDRSSIHRPQVCMTAAGHEIEKERYFQIQLDPSRPPLEVCVLDMIKHNPEGTGAEYSYYAYWFVGKDRETASHVQRMIWMASDRIFRGVSHRWAYIALFGSRSPERGNDAHIQTVADFVARLHPAIVLDPDAILPPSDAPSADPTGDSHE
jgi:hypothetical protein